ncbi:MAG TPA: NADH-quinone oxidoreductase subunit J [Pyrinomonadaceae bacterium]
MPLTSFESLFFWIFGITAIFAGLLTVMARNAVHSALFLISSLVSIAALFVISGAEFIAGVQILVYVGGVMVLFLFVIMLVNVSAEEQGKDEIFNKKRQVTTALVFCFLLVLGMLYAVNKGSMVLLKQNQPAAELLAENQAAQDARLKKSATGTSRITKNTEVVANSLYRFASLPFEIASALLLVAIIGSVMLARTLRQEASVDDLAPGVLADASLLDPELVKLEAAAGQESHG